VTPSSTARAAVDPSTQHTPPITRKRTRRPTRKYIGTDIYCGMTRNSRPDISSIQSVDASTQHVMDSLRRIVRVLGASARGPAARHGATGAQLFVLHQIDAAPGLSIGELAARTLTGQSTVSEVVSRLVERGLVARHADPSDARQTRLQLTARGRSTIRDTEPTAQERLASGLASLAPAERDDLARALDRWLEAAGLAELPATMFFEDERAPSRPAS
jgi:MarR family transcriptional regulator, lower aerobic nicotinate degradation pathway regulator